MYFTAGNEVFREKGNDTIYAQSRKEPGKQIRWIPNEG